MCLYFHGYYACALVPATLLLYIYKAIMLPYPPNSIGLEVTFVFVYALLEWARLRIGEGAQSVLCWCLIRRALSLHSPSPPPILTLRLSSIAR